MTIVEQVGKFIQDNMPQLNVTTDEMPTSPDRCAMISGTDLNPSGRYGALVRITFRGDPGALNALHDASYAAELLDGFEGALCYDGSYVTGILIENGPAQLGADQNRRSEYTLSIRVFYCE